MKAYHKNPRTWIQYKDRDYVCRWCGVIFHNRRGHATYTPKYCSRQHCGFAQRKPRQTQYAASHPAWSRGLVPHLDHTKLGATYIYALVRTGNGAPFYIGKADDVVTRERQHRENARLNLRRSRVYDYIRYLWKQGDDFQLRPIALVPSAIWPIYEIRAINVLRKAGFDLRNVAPGGIASPMAESTREKLRQSALGRSPSAESRLKMSLAKKGKAPWNKGKKTGRPSPRRGTVGLYGKPVHQLDPGTGKILQTFKSLTLACLAIGLPELRSGIGLCARGDQKTAYSYRWEYAEVAS